MKIQGNEGGCKFYSADEFVKKIREFNFVEYDECGPYFRGAGLYGYCHANDDGELVRNISDGEWSCMVFLTDDDEKIEAYFKGLVSEEEEKNLICDKVYPDYVARFKNEANKLSILAFL